MGPPAAAEATTGGHVDARRRSPSSAARTSRPPWRAHVRLVQTRISTAAPEALAVVGLRRWRGEAKEQEKAVAAAAAIAADEL